MLNKIRNEIDTFTSTIKEVKGCDEMITYMNTNIYASIKLLMYASSTFSIYGRVMMFFIIAFTGLLVFSSIGAIILNISYVAAIALALYVLILIYVMHFKNYLIFSINQVKSLKKSKENQ